MIDDVNKVTLASASSNDKDLKEKLAHGGNIEAAKVVGEAIAQKAKKALNNHFIECEIIRLEPNMTKKGCAYGIKFQCINLYAAKDALDNSSVKYTEIISL